MEPDQSPLFGFEYSHSPDSRSVQVSQQLLQGSRTGLIDIVLNAGCQQRPDVCPKRAVPGLRDQVRLYVRLVDDKTLLREIEGEDRRDTVQTDTVSQTDRVKIGEIPALLAIGQGAEPGPQQLVHLEGGDGGLAAEPRVLDKEEDRPARAVG